jgi:hypothetical protein
MLNVNHYLYVEYKYDTFPAFRAGYQDALFAFFSRNFIAKPQLKLTGESLFSTDKVQSIHPS